MHGLGERYFSPRTTRYIHDCNAVQEQLHQVLTQMSGFTLLLLTRRLAPSLGAGPLELASKRMAVAGEQFRSLEPHGDRARHHHHHLGLATELVGQCVATAHDCLRTRADDVGKDRLTRLLRAALEHLKLTARLLPGFSMVDLGQACCAAHVTAENNELVSTIA